MLLLCLVLVILLLLLSFFFFNDTATTEIYTLSLHDALPILGDGPPLGGVGGAGRERRDAPVGEPTLDRKSTRLNSSHSQISYAVFCLKKKKKQHRGRDRREQDRRKSSSLASHEGRISAELDV